MAQIDNQLLWNKTEPFNKGNFYLEVVNAWRMWKRNKGKIFGKIKQSELQFVEQVNRNLNGPFSD